MVLLKDLKLPALTPEVIDFFAGQQVVTVEDFLLHDLRSFNADKRWPSLSAKVTQAVAAVLSYLEGVHEPWSTGSDLFDRPVKFLPIYCESIDSLLEGGLQEGKVTELVGESSTGKTQMCMQAAASVAHWSHSRVVYVDTCNSFSATRVANMLMNFLEFDGGGCTEEQADHFAFAMKRIQRIGIFDVSSMLSFVGNLHEILQSRLEIGDETPRVRLLVIDSGSSVIGPILGDSNAGGYATMMNLARCLNKLAVKNRVAILITNHAVVGGEGQMQPALGESWLAVPHVRLWLARDPSTNLCTISIIKHSSLACDQRRAFYIDKDGLQSISEEQTQFQSNIDCTASCSEI